MIDDAATIGLSGVRGYISYSHGDHGFVQRLLRHLIPAAQAELGVTEIWTDAAITNGARWSDIAADALVQANVFVLCMSPAYLASEFLYHEELPAIQARARSSGALVIPVILRPCSWWGFVGDYQAVPFREGAVVPISEWRPEDDGYHAAAMQVVEAIAHRFSQDAETASLLPTTAKDFTPRPILPGPPGYHKVSPDEIDRAVKAVVARRAAKSQG